MGFESLRRHPDSGIFLLRKRVPKRLRRTIGKREIKISLHTRDVKVARIRHLELLAKVERALSRINAAIVDGEGRLLASLQCKFAPDTAPTDAPPADAPPADASSIDAAIASFATTSSAEAPSAVVAAAPTANAPVPLRALFKSYGKEAQLSPATVKRWTPVVERLIGHLGHDDAAAITRADLVAWKDALLAGGMKNVTVRDVYLAATKALLQFAVDQGSIPENPAKEVKVRVKRKVKEREKGFDGEEAKTILTATLRPFSHLISEEMAAARRWLPWIGAYTGARINELTPLTAADFVKRDGIWIIRIRGANNKTRTYREVPLHGHLIEQGLLDYAKSRGKRPLFYDPGRSRGGKDSNPHHKKVAERLAEWIRSLGIEGVAPNHGWRHRFSTVARFVGMPEDVRNIIQGHAGGKVADDYGETWPLVALREIEKLPRYVV
jgi:integrase